MGTIHSGHLRSEGYSIEVFQDVVRKVNPDYVLVEIPPGRLSVALNEHHHGKVEESRVKRFPEYVQGLFPLHDELDFEMVPCAAWTREMADARRAKLEDWRSTRPEESAQVRAAQERADEAQRAEGIDDDPRGIHSPRYHELVRQGMEPYDRLFNDDLGPGGWTNINEAHFALIDEAIREHAAPGKRFLITFGSWHAYWFIDQLKERDDVVLRDLREFLE